jgi:DNA-binding ferritin-like protein (Dps family)
MMKMTDYLRDVSNTMEKLGSPLKLEAQPPGELANVLRLEEATLAALAKEITSLTGDVNTYFDDLIEETNKSLNKMRATLIQSYDNQLQIMKTNFRLYRDKLDRYYGESTISHNFDSLTRQAENCKNYDEYLVFIKNLKVGVEDAKILKEISSKQEHVDKLMFYKDELLNSLNFSPKIGLNDLKTELLEPWITKIETDVRTKMELKATVQSVTTLTQGFPSRIITKSEQLKLIDQWLGVSNKRVRYELLYKGSRDGFTARSFHNKCDQKEHTISIARTTKKAIYGGYADQSWDVIPNVEEKESKSAFVFDMSKKKKYPINPGCNASAIKTMPNHGPCFSDDVRFIENDQPKIIFKLRLPYVEDFETMYKYLMFKEGKPIFEDIDEPLDELEVFKISYEGIPAVAPVKRVHNNVKGNQMSLGTQAMLHPPIFSGGCAKQTPSAEY